MQKQIRTFIAIELPNTMHKKLDDTIQEIRYHVPDIFRWVHPGNIHLTIKFLGNVSTSNIELLSRTINAVVSQKEQFKIKVGEFGVYPKIRIPRIIWVGLKAPKELFEIQQRIEKETANLGYEVEKRKYSPHLTIGRLKKNVSPQEINLASRQLENVKIGFLGTIKVGSIHLFQSELKPTGPIYTSLFSARLLLEGTQ